MDELSPITIARTILIVDDSRSNRRLIRQVLEKRGHSCLEAEDGEQGIAVAIEHKPELIVLDIMMPDLDGFEVCRRLRANEQTAYLPILFLSAKDQVEDRVRGLVAGGDDFVTKPFSIRELQARIERLLARSSVYLDANPTTYLPGTHAITEKVQSWIRDGTPFAAGYVDIDNFKSFNDCYGFIEGDRVIQFVARLMRMVSAEIGGGDEVNFIGHIGGDDFLFLCAPERVDSFANRVQRMFQEGRNEFHPMMDVERGFYISQDRQGQAMEYPLISVSVAVITRRVRHAGELAQAAVELKHFAKVQGGNMVVNDRRRTPPERDGAWILLGEGERTRAFALRDYLEARGYRVFVSYSGPDLIRDAHRIRPRAILTGKSLPMLGHDEAHALLARLEGTRTIPMVDVADATMDTLGLHTIADRLHNALSGPGAPTHGTTASLPLPPAGPGAAPAAALAGADSLPTSPALASSEAPRAVTGTPPHALSTDAESQPLGLAPQRPLSNPRGVLEPATVIEETKRPTTLRPLLEGDEEPPASNSPMGSGG
jgi:diguanylate cyclase (GGDEF)-like protein